MTQTDPAACAARQPFEPALVEFAAGLAHDLSNALNSVGLHADMAKLMLDRGEIDNARRMLDGVQAEFRRNVQLMAALRRFTSVPNAVSIQPVDLAALLAEARESACLLLDIRPEAVVTSQSGAVGHVPIDRDVMVFIIVQLVRNALEAGATRVEIAVDGDPAQWRLQVDDDGPGIDEEIRPKLFGMFASTRRSDGHLGLGLWVVDRLCAANNLRIDAPAGNSSGARFVVSSAA